MKPYALGLSVCLYVALSGSAYSASRDHQAVPTASLTSTSMPTLAPALSPTPSPMPAPTAPPSGGGTSHRHLHFWIRSLRVQSSYRADFSLRSKPVRQVRRGTTIYIVLYWRVRNGTSHRRPTYAFAIYTRRHQVARTSFTGKLSAYPPNDYVASISYAPTKPGRYALFGRVTLGVRVKQAWSAVVVR